MRTLLLFLLTLSISQLEAQVPNGNFESWGDFGQWFESPESWHTSNTELEQAVFKSTDATEGMYSMFVDAVNFGAGSYGEAWVSVPCDGDSAVVTASVKGEIEGSAQISVSVEKYLDGNFVTFASWYSNTSVADWEEIEISTDSEPCDSLVIRVVSVGGDFAFGDAEMWIDNLQVNDLSTSVDDQADCFFEVSVVPAWQRLLIMNPCGEQRPIRILDTQGRLVVEGNFQSISTAGFTPGVYFVTDGVRSRSVYIR